jgi:hypothetical protein
MVRQGYFSSAAQLDAHAAMWHALHDDRQQAGLAWQLGMDGDTLDDNLRRLEIRNWLRQFLC